MRININRNSLVYYKFIRHFILIILYSTCYKNKISIIFRYFINIIIKYN